jgi:predicted house-cleaning noncanonical NTP pyrophosphatase (MazG superfamily)
MTIMHKFKNNKLWRDKIISMIEKQGSIAHTKQLSDQEYDEQLRLKLIEESAEVVTASSRTALIEELADTYEVIDALCALHTISKEELLAVQTKKFESRGGFYGRTFVTVIEHSAGSDSERYCRAQPDKYPEIV